MFSAWLIPATVLAFQFSGLPPHSGYEPPAAAAAKSLAESTAGSPKNLLTHAELTQFRETGRYAETLDLASKLEKASPWIRKVTFGKTPEGRDMILMIVSKDRAFTPARAAKTGKPIVLIQNGIHAGEIAGKDATAMLIRDLAVTKRYASLLDHVIVLSIPVFNVDGHENFSPYHRINQNGPKEMGFRVTAQRLNLNRDYIKADAPEMRAWLAMFDAWMPDFFIDNHVTDGEDHQYDLTVGMETGPTAWPSVAEWSRRDYLPKLFDRMDADGHVMMMYDEPLEHGDPAKGIVIPSFSPRYSHSYVAARNRAGLLVETHSLKSYRTRVWAHYDVMLETLRIIAADPAALKQAVRTADEQVSKLGTTHEHVPLAVRVDTKDGEPFTFKAVASSEVRSPVTGAMYPVYSAAPIDVPTMEFAKLITTISPAAPTAYAIPAAWTPVIDLLQLHGIKIERTPVELSRHVEVTRFTDVQWAGRPFEGRLMLTFHSSVTPEMRTLPAGTVLVPMNQPAARLAMQILEPDAPDSAVRWGFFNTIFERKEYASSYVLEPMAQQMLEQDPKLKEEYEARLKKDPKFAADPRARQAFFYEHSSWADKALNVYPVLRIE
jgi:Zinc carboxypeptidase